MSRSLIPPGSLSFPSADNPSCDVTMTKGQAALVARAMAFFADKAVGLSVDERAEAEALRNMATEIEPGVLNGWCL